MPSRRPGGVGTVEVSCSGAWASREGEVRGKEVGSGSDWGVDRPWGLVDVLGPAEEEDA